MLSAEIKSNSLGYNTIVVESKLVPSDGETGIPKSKPFRNVVWECIGLGPMITGLFNASALEVRRQWDSCGLQ